MNKVCFSSFQLIFPICQYSKYTNINDHNPMIQTQINHNGFFSIEGVSYWDYRINTVLDDLGSLIVFSNDYFGSLRGDPELGYRITDDKFTNWKVNADSSEVWKYKSNTISCPPDDYVVRNPYGLLRGALNPIDEEYVTRVSGYYCGERYKYHVDVVELWDECIEDAVHNAAHFVVGGQVPLSKINDPNSPITPNELCLSFITEQCDINNADDADKKHIIQRMGDKYGCFTSNLHVHGIILHNINVKLV
eukprot:184177_1